MGKQQTNTVGTACGRRVLIGRRLQDLVFRNEEASCRRGMVGDVVPPGLCFRWDRPLPCAPQSEGGMLLNPPANMSCALSDLPHLVELVTPALCAVCVLCGPVPRDGPLVKLTGHDGEIMVRDSAPSFSVISLPAVRCLTPDPPRLPFPFPSPVRAAARSNHEGNQPSY